MGQTLDRRQALAAAGLLGTAAAAGAEDARKPAGSFRFQPPVITRTVSLDPKAAAAVVSPDGRAMSVLFGDPKLGDLQIGLGAPEKVLSATKLVTFQAAVKAPADGSLIGYRQILQGFLDKGKGSRVVIVADLVGTTKVIEYPYGQEVKDENFVHAFFSPDVNQTVGTEVVAPLPEYAGTITLMVQTRTPKDQVLAAIDSLDIEALLTGVAPAAKRSPAKKRTAR
jgi:hypothetical protein